MFSIPDRSFKSFENYPVKLLAKETKCTSLEVRAHSTFHDNLISNYDFGPVKLPGFFRETGPWPLFIHPIVTYSVRLIPERTYTEMHQKNNLLSVEKEKGNRKERIQHKKLKQVPIWKTRKRS